MRQLVPDRDGEAVHLYFSGTEGLHASIYDTMPAEAFDACGIGKGRGCWNFREDRWGGGTVPRGDEQLFAPVSNNVWFRGAIMRATWPNGRLWGIVPAVGGEVAAVVLTRNCSAPSAAASATLVVDAATVRNGSLLAEVVVAASGQVLPGFASHDCVPFSGDAAEATMAWGGRTAIPTGGAAVQIRFVLLRARLYHFALR